MKKVIFLCCMVFVTLLSSAQSWNPYVNQGIVSPSPLLPVEFNGEGMVSFNIGNTGSSNMVHSPNNPANNLKVIITLNQGTPNKNNPLSALGGTWKNRFNWTYDASAKTFTGVQKSAIPPYSQGTLTVDYKVETNSPLMSPSNGFSISLIPPAYMSGPNHSQDDAVSSRTYTRAYDYGDAPVSYGMARHEINVNKDPYSGLYSRYIYLGTKVDQEPEAKSSAKADGDDKNGVDDEDGVVFPALHAGSTVTIPVVVTAHDESYGFLNAWFDWNGDGDFTDAGEKVAGTPLPVYSSGTYHLTVSIPETAVTGVPTFARFRIGANGGPTASNAWGEAEDYQVTILENLLLVTVTSTNVQNYDEFTGSISLAVSGGKKPYQFNWNTGATTQNLTNLGAGQYSVIVTDAQNRTVTKNVTILQPVKNQFNYALTNVVELTGNRDKRDVLLTWVTPQENNTAWFVVERSTDGDLFKQIGSVILAAETSATRTEYQFTDENVDAEIVTYRIRLFERDHSEILSNTYTEILDNKAGFNIAVHPNPVSDQYTIVIERRGSYQLEMIDSFGKLVFVKRMDVPEIGFGSLELQKGSLVVGQYFLRVTDNDTGKSKTVKVIMTQF